MENATKALVMAGGVLIAIMVIAALVYASSNWQVVPKAQDEAAVARQLSLFNQQYESYAKSRIYGTELVSLLNKAIDNNDKYSVNPGEEMYIDIVFELINPIYETKKSYKIYYVNNKPSKTEADGNGENLETLAIGKGVYSLSKNLNNKINGDRYTIKTFLDKFSDENSDVTDRKYFPGNYVIDENGQKYKEYSLTIPDVSEFKTRIFECKEVKYDAEDNDTEGRIKCMYFKEYVEEANSTNT